MKKKNVFFTILLSFSLVFLVGCDSGSDSGNLTGPQITIDFDCLGGSGTLQCTGFQTGGDLPFVFFWEATSQTPISGLGVSTVVFDYSRFCDSSETAFSVTVRLTITDDEGRGQSRGPISKSYSVCGDSAALSSSSGSTLSFEDWMGQQEKIFGN